MENKSNILNTIFTRNTLQRWVEKKHDNAYDSIIARYKINQKNTNMDIISEVYSRLKKEHRNEYFYKNTLLNKLLLGVHSINTTTALTEIPVAGSKADFILINGKAVVYEIKTELDNLDRLKNQINDYYKAFNYVAVLSCEKNLENLKSKVNEIDKPVGIYILQNNGKIKTVRQPLPYNKDLSIKEIFKILRKNEFEDILRNEFGYLPNVSQFEYYTKCMELLETIETTRLYKLYVEQLKKRIILSKEEFYRVPYELKFLAYFAKLKKEDYANLIQFLNEPYGGEDKCISHT